jgi:phosphatidylserine decarboxylase
MEDVMKELRDYLSRNRDFKVAFEAAFMLAKSMGIPQFKEYHTFDDYLNFYQTMLTWTPSENVDGNKIYYQLCMFYFVIDLPPVKSFQNPILPTSTPPWSWLSQWLIDYAAVLGEFMDTPASINAETLATFYASPKYHMSDYPPKPWETFNQFFARKINPAVRPIDPGLNVIVSPADSTCDGSWLIDNNANVTTFDSKHLPWSISQLLQDSKYGPQFKNGKFMHAFLAPWDYHRQHAPVSGIVREAKVIPGLCYLQVVAEPDENGKPQLRMRRGLVGRVNPALPTPNDGSTSIQAPDDPGYQFLQARGLIVIESPFGLVAVLPIGMCQISSVVLTVKEGDELKKGSEISYFQFGGSDIVVVFEAASEVDITATMGTHYNYGQEIGKARIMGESN